MSAYSCENEQLDEAAAEYARMIMPNGAAMKDFVDKARSGAFADGDEKKSMNILRSFYEALKSFIQKVKNVFKGNKKAQNKASQNAFGMDIDELETARDMLEKTFRESERQTKLAEKGGRVDGKGTIPQPPDGDSSLYTKEPLNGETEGKVRESRKVEKKGASGYTKKYDAREMKQLREYIMQKNFSSNEISVVDCKEIGNNFYIWENLSKDTYNVTQAIKIEGNEDRIDLVRKGIKNGTYKIGIKLGETLNRGSRNGGRRSNLHDAVREDGRSTRGTGGVSSGQSESNAVGRSFESNGNSPEVRTGRGVKYSIKEGSDSVTGKTISWEAILDEAAAEYTGHILNSPETINRFIDDARSGKLVEGGTAEQNMGVVKRLWQSIKDFIDKVKKLFKGDKKAQDKAAKDAFGMPMSELEKARDLLGKAFVESERVVKGKAVESVSDTSSTADAVPLPLEGKASTPSASKADSSLEDGAEKKDGDAKPEREYFKEAERDLNEADDKGEIKEKGEDYFKEPKDSEDTVLGNVKYSLKKHFNKQVDEALGNTLGRGYRVYVGKTSSWLAKCGFNPELPMLMNQSHIRDINHPKSPDNIHYHGLDPELIKQIPNELNNPVMIYDSITPELADRKNAVCVVTKLKDGNDPIIISVKANETDGAKYYDVTLETVKSNLYNFVSSEYGRNNFFEHLNDVIEQDALLYANKNKTLKLFSDSGLQLPTRLNSLGFDKIIHQSRNIVNPYSMQKSENNSGERKTSIKMDDVLRQNATLKKAYTQLRMEYAKLQSGKKVADTKRIATVVKNLLDENGFSYDSARLTEQFESLTAEAQAIFEGKMDFEIFSGKVRDVARAVIDEGTRSDSVAYQESKKVRDYLRTTAISLSAEDRANLGDEYETIRKGTFGRFRLVKEGGTPIDVAYQEMSELFPQFFGAEEVGSSAQVRKIVEVLDGLQSLKTDPFGGYADEAADWLSGMMIDRIFNEVFVSGSTGKVDVSVDMKALRESMGDNLQNIMNRERTWRTKEYDKLQRQFEKKTKTYTESRQKAIKIKQVKLHTERISKALVNPSERFAVPEDLKKPVAEFLQCIDLTSDRMNDKTREQLGDLMKTYKAMAEQEYELNMVIDPDLYNNLETISDSIKELGTKDTRISDLPLATLEKMRNAVMAMEASLRNYNKAFREGKAVQIDALAEKAVAEIKELRKDNKKNSKIWGGASDLMNFEMLNPFDYFHQMGDTFEDLFMGLREGENVQIRDLALAKNNLDKQMEAFEINPDKLSGKKAKAQEFKLANGETVEFTKAQVMSLYLLWRQNASHEHILEGGFRPGEVQQKLIEKKGEESKVVLKVSEDYSSVRPSLDDVAKILDTLSDNEKKFAESVSDFFVNECAEWGNEVAMKLYGYKKFNTPNYFPIVSDKMYLQEDFGVSADSTIKNTGFIKEANNPFSTLCEKGLFAWWSKL